MKKNFLYLEILITILIINIFIFGLNYIMVLLSLFLILCYIYFNKYHKSKGITYLIFGMYMCGLYLQFFFLHFKPEMFTALGIDLYLLKDELIIQKALTTSLIFLLFFLISFNLSSIVFNNFKKINLGKSIKKIKININSVFILSMLSVIEFLLRLTFHIAAPGMQPLIHVPFVSNIIYFSMIGIKLFFFRSILNSLIRKHRAFSYKLLFISILVTIIYSLPSILLGWRGSFVTTYIFVFLYFFIVMKKDRRLKYLVINITLALPIALYMIYQTALIRGSVTNDSYYLFEFLLNRFVGWPDSLAIENYLIHMNNYAIMDFLHGRSLASFHTYNVRGFPEGRINAYSRPIFSSLKLLMGNISVIVGSIILGTLIASMEKIIKFRRANFFRQDVFMPVYLIFITFQKVIFSGDIILLFKDFPVMLLVYTVLTKLFVLDQENSDTHN